MSDIPLFPLNVVLMPGAPLPLHIFEDRYKQMVNECLEQESEFGMVFADESGTRKVGCTAKIVELVERYDDGRMLILVEGSRRFRLNNVLTGKPYYVGRSSTSRRSPRRTSVPGRGVHSARWSGSSRPRPRAPSASR